MNIGFRVRARREQQELSLRDLARRTGLSASFLSQVERDLVAPSISSLKTISGALDLRVAELLTDSAAANSAVLRRADRPAWALAKVHFELLARRANRKMEPQLITYDPGGDSGEHPLTHEGDEFGLLLQGRAECWMGDDIVELEEGDSVYFDACTPHRLRNVGDQQCVYLLVITPASF